MSADELALADEPLDELDEQILLAMAQLYTSTDPMPAGLPDRIKFELTLAALHAEVAELSQLSLAGVREDSTRYTPTQSVTFTSSTLSVMVTVGPAGEDAAPDTVRIDGWVTGGSAGIELHVGSAVFSTATDDTGRFAFEQVPHGSARFVLRALEGDQRPIVTPAIEV